MAVDCLSVDYSVAECMCLCAVHFALESIYSLDFDLFAELDHLEVSFD